ncbi:MAG: hypothetical protein IIC50_15500 [Planctomycetes bacterium]|nr:hypothetical protein [Planctomycetota bacterium]
MTRDGHVCCRFSVENLMLLQQVLTDLHPTPRMTPNRLPLELTQESCGQLQNLYLHTDLGQLDCLIHISGVGDFDAVKANSIAVKLSMGPCRILSLDALIQDKETLGRQRDKDSTLHLKAIREQA